MPRPRLGYGRPGTTVIPAGWNEAHAPVAAATMRCPVKLRHPGTTESWNNTTEQTDHVPLDPYWEGGARVQAVKSGRTDGSTVVAGDEVHVAGYLMTLPLEVDPAVGDLVDVDDAYADDPALAGRTLRVTDVILGSERFERDVFATITDDIT